MAQSQPIATFHTANVYDLPLKSTTNNKNKYQRSLPLSQRIENLRKNGKNVNSKTNPPVPTSIVIKSYLPQSSSNSIEIYECLPNSQQNMPSATHKWIHDNLRTLNSVQQSSIASSQCICTPPAPYSPDDDPAIDIYKLSTDLPLNHKYYNQNYFVSALNIIIAACIKHEFLSNAFTSYITHANVLQLKQDALNQFTHDWNPQNMDKYTNNQDNEELFLRLFNKPDFILKHSKAKCCPNLSNFTKHVIDGMIAYKPLYCSNNNADIKYITIHSFNNPASVDENVRNRAAAEFNSVCEALRANKDKIALSIFYSINFMDPLHPAWFYIVKFKETTASGANMPRLETEEKAKKSTIVIDDDDIVMNENESKPKHVRSDKEENDDTVLNNTAHDVINGGIHHKNDTNEDASLHLTYDETQANHNSNDNNNNNNDNILQRCAPTEALSDIISAETHTAEYVQRVSSQPHIAAVEIMVNCNTEEANENNDDLDATFVSVDDEARDNDNVAFNLSLEMMSDSASPKKKKDDLAQTILQDTMIEDQSENNNNHLAATIMVDDDDNEESLLLEIGDDTVDIDHDNEDFNEKVRQKSDKREDEMSQILRNINDDNHNNNNDKEEYVFDDLDATQHENNRKENKISDDSSEESQDLSTKPKQHKKEDEHLKMDELDKEVEIVQNETQQMIDTIKAMGIEQDLVEFVLQEIDPNPKDINILAQLCLTNMDYYAENKKKMKIKRQQNERNKKGNNANKKGKKRKRNVLEDNMDEEYDVYDDEEDEESDHETYVPQRKKRKVSPRRSARSRRKNKKLNDVLILSSDESENENANNYRNKNQAKRENKPKKKRSIKSKSRKKKQFKPKHTKATESKMFKEKNFMDGNIFKTGKCRDFESMTDAEADDDDIEACLV